MVVLNEIIRLCRPRMLWRMRSRHVKLGRKEGSPFLGLTLRRVTEILSRMRATRGKTAFLKESKRLLSLLDDMENAEPSSDTVFNTLRGIVQQCVGLTGSVKLRSLWGGINPTDIQPSQLESLANTIEEMARYGKIAELLNLSARKYMALVRARVQTVVPDESAFQPPPDGEKAPSLGVVLERLGKPKGTLRRICKSLGITITDAQTKYNTRYAKMRHESRVHAEIQLLRHYEQLDPTAPVARPRYIVSSKSPCILCAALMTCHGGYVVPPSHGVFYPQWRLPGTGLPDPLVLRFVEDLEQDLLHVVDSILSPAFTQQPDGGKGKLKPRIKGAVELGSLELRLSNSSLVPFAIGGREIVIEDDEQQSPDEAGSGDAGTAATIETDGPGVVDGEVAVLEVNPLPDVHDEQGHTSTAAEQALSLKSNATSDGSSAVMSSSDEGMRPSSCPGSLSPQLLQKGQVVSGTVCSANPSLWFTAPSVRFSVDYVGNPESKRRESSIRFTVEWLEDSAVESLRLGGQVSITDVLELDPTLEPTVASGQHGEFYFVAGQTVVRFVRETVT